MTAVPSPPGGSGPCSTRSRMTLGIMRPRHQHHAVGQCLRAPHLFFSLVLLCAGRTESPRTADLYARAQRAVDRAGAGRAHRTGRSNLSIIVIDAGGGGSTGLCATGAWRLKKRSSTVSGLGRSPKRCSPASG